MVEGWVIMRRARQVANQKKITIFDPPSDSEK